MKDEFSLAGKVIIITGGGGGIGQHLALSMTKRSAFVYSLDLKVRQLKRKQESLFQINCDITNNYEFKKICDVIFKKHKRIDVLINGAGITLPNYPGKLYPEKDWHKTINVNLNAAFNCSQIVIPFMKRRKNGSIINITSINAQLAFPNNPAYVASKGGLSMLGKALARDWGKFGIRVNNLGPGYIKTEMTKSSYKNKKLRENRTNRTMLGRWGEIDDLVGPCIFLASDASRYITAQDIYVDGGWVANGLSNE